jgi:hypothetical protein
MSETCLWGRKKEREREREGGEAFFINVGEDDNEQVIWKRN